MTTAETHTLHSLTQPPPPVKCLGANTNTKGLTSGHSQTAETLILHPPNLVSRARLSRGVWPARLLKPNFTLPRPRIHATSVAMLHPPNHGQT